MDAELWQLIAFCAGTGGSIFVIGSAAGVALMGLEKVDFVWYAKNISIAAAAGYFTGIGTYLLQHNFQTMFEQTAPVVATLPTMIEQGLTKSLFPCHPYLNPSHITLINCHPLSICHTLIYYLSHISSLICESFFIYPISCYPLLTFILPPYIDIPLTFILSPLFFCSIYSIQVTWSWQPLCPL